MERDYEAELEHDLIMMITEKILDHSINDWKIEGGMMMGKVCPNPFRAFTNVNPRLLVNCIMEGDKVWGECYDDYVTNRRMEQKESKDRLEKLRS